jgi:hypothetical protein
MKQVCFEREELFLYSLGYLSQRARFASVSSGYDLPVRFLGLDEQSESGGNRGYDPVGVNPPGSFELTAIRWVLARHVEPAHVDQDGSSCCATNSAQRTKSQAPSAVIRTYFLNPCSA